MFSSYTYRFWFVKQNLRGASKSLTRIAYQRKRQMRPLGQTSRPPKVVVERQGKPNSFYLFWSNNLKSERRRSEGTEDSWELTLHALGTTLSMQYRILLIYPQPNLSLLYHKLSLLSRKIVLWVPKNTQKIRMLSILCAYLHTQMFHAPIFYKNAQ